MGNYLLKPVFKSIFGREFDPDKFEDRLEMQKAVYLLQNMGISVGDYGFMWYKHGPYSQTLQNDILTLQTSEDVNVNFSNDAIKAIDELKNAVQIQNKDYQEYEWLECLGSLHYIKESLMPSSADENTLIHELQTRKEHLNKEKDNRLALQILNKLGI